VLTGLVQVAFVLAAGAVTAGAMLAGILYLAGDKHPHAVTAAAEHSSWLASAIASHSG
jgi:hypothetical protein